MAAKRPKRSNAPEASSSHRVGTAPSVAPTQEAALRPGADINTCGDAWQVVAIAIEYGLIAALVSVAAVPALGNPGMSLSIMFSSVSTTLENAVAGSGATT